MVQEPLAPGDETELAALVRQASAEGQPLHIEGSGSKRHHGPAAPDGARVISMRRLGQVTAHSPGDLVVSMQAGTRLIDLQRVLAEHHQWLPVDPPYAAATIGGVLATASAGPRRLGYGSIKDALLGLRTMDPDGVITRSGGRVVKNVSGFDLHRLQVGGFGALGILVEAHFKVSTRPQVSGAWLAGQPSVPSALRLLLAVQASALRPVALEALDAGAMSGCRALLPEIPDAPALALVGIDGSRAVFDRHLRELEALRAQAAARATTVIEGSATDRLWQGFRDAPARAAGDITLRLGALPHDLPGLLEGVDLGDCGLTAVSCHAGNGVARLRFARPTDVTAWLARPALVALESAARARGGYLVAEAAPLDLPGRASLPWTPATAPIHPLFRRLHQSWDPRDILNRGRAGL
jgi:glycolate oxidase FAD binding subunit